MGRYAKKGGKSQNWDGLGNVLNAKNFSENKNKNDTLIKKI